jgi:hypothetical protein
MAARRKPPVKKVKFEVTRSGIAGIGIVCFCIFLWMFLLGVWTGQSMLLPKSKAEKKVAREVAPSNLQDTAPLHIEAVSNKKIKKVQ